LNIDDDWVRLMNFWKAERKKCIPIYLYDPNQRFENQKHVEILDKISALLHNHCLKYKQLKLKRM